MQYKHKHSNMLVSVPVVTVECGEVEPRAKQGQQHGWCSKDEPQSKIHPKIAVKPGEDMKHTSKQICGALLKHGSRHVEQVWFKSISSY